jgi:hypothetical protein
MEVFKELIRREPNFLDKPIEQLAPLAFVGQSAVAAYRSLISRLDSLPMTEAQKRKTLADGQEAGEMLLEIEARIGELLPSAEEGKRLTTTGSPRGKAGQMKPEKVLPDGINSKQAHTARTIARNPEIVREIIKEAKENEDIPTKTAVLNRIKLERYMEKHPPQKEEKPDISQAALQVSNRLADSYAKLIELWKNVDYIPESIRDSITDTIGKLYALIGETNELQKIN